MAVYECVHHVFIYVFIYIVILCQNYYTQKVAKV